MHNKPRQGGAHALKGFSFQAAVALVRLTWMLTCRHGIVRVRYEGAQDIDIGYTDGRELYIQAKDYEKGNFKLSHLHDAAIGFCRDMISAMVARPHGPFPQFQLLMTDMPTQEDVVRVIRRAYLIPDSKQVAAGIAQQYRHGKTNKEIIYIARDVLASIEYVVCLGGEPIEDLVSVASMELIRFGVPANSVKVCVDSLRQQLKPGHTYHLEDVAALLHGLPQTHPASPHASIRLIPSISGPYDVKDLRKQFYRGAPVGWEAIASELDVKRTLQGELEREIHLTLRGGGMVVVTGVAGSGKSTLARRTAWDMHRRGRAIVLEVRERDDVTDLHWDQVSILSKASNRAIVVIVDDIWRSSEFVEGFKRVNGPGLCVLATSRPNERNNAVDPTMGIRSVLIDSVTKEELDALAAKLRRPPAELEEAIEHACSTGQIFMLALLLQQQSIDLFARNILAPLSEKLAGLYLDVCIGNMYDLSTPLSVMIKRVLSPTRLWREKELEGLLFESSSSPVRLNAGHSIIAQAIVQVSNTRAVARALDLCTLCRYEDDIERHYVIKLLEQLGRDARWIEECHAEAEGFEREALRMKDFASYLDLCRMASILTSISCLRAAEVLRSQTTPEKIVTGPDAAYFMSLVTEENFDTTFDVMSKFYSVRRIPYARRRFISITRHFGNYTQHDQMAFLMEPWLRDQGYPLQETFALVEALCHSAPQVVQNHVSIIDAILATHTLTEKMALALIRLARRSKDRKAYAPLERELIIALREGPLQGNEKVAAATAGASARLSDNSHEIFEIAYALIQRGKLQRPWLDLFTPVAFIAPLEYHQGLELLIDGFPQSRRYMRRANDLRHILRRVKAEKAASGVRAT